MAGRKLGGFGGLVEFLLRFGVRSGFRLPQRLYLRTLKNFVTEKSGKRCEILDKIGKSGNFEKVHFFPVSAPENV